MKKYFLTVLSSLFILTSCSVNNNTDIPDIQKRIIHWNLIKTTGGVAGVNHQFPLETVIWTFDVTSSKLTVENNNTDDTKEDALDEGSYVFSIKEKANKKTFLSINTEEFGGFTINNNQLIIDQNNLSDGSDGADGFIYTFHRTIEVVE